MDIPNDCQTWRTWFEAYGPRLLLFARQQTRSFADAEDVLQEAVLSVWQTANNTDAPSPASAFVAIRRKAVDLARRNIRRNRREQVAHELSDHPAGWFEPLVENRERCEMIREALNTLPPEQQEVLTLKIWGELTFEEIARTLEIPANTAASRYRYALNTLRKSLTPTLL